MEERGEAGKPGGLREFLAAGTEASRRANPLQRGAEIGASSALVPLAALTPGICLELKNNSKNCVKILRRRNRRILGRIYSYEYERRYTSNTARISRH